MFNNINYILYFEIIIIIIIHFYNQPVPYLHLNRFAKINCTSRLIFIAFQTNVAHG